MNHLNKLSSQSRRYFLLALLISLVAGERFDKATDEIGQMLLLVTAITGLVGSILMLILSWKADQITRDQRRPPIRNKLDIIPWPTRHTINQTLAEIEAQERRS